MKLIVVTGGVMSWLGKWITAASIGILMKSSGYSVTMMKLDPYLQIDAGTMSPFEHGETFVTKDGFETDLDLWHYERFIDEELTREASVTTGQIYLSVIQNEREGKYLGKTVQVIPHVTNEIKDRIHKASDGKDLTIIEIWGTVWDIEWPHFIEAVRQLRREYGREDVMFVHVVPIICVSTSGEMKTKALQHSVIKLREMGVHPSILVCRTTKALTADAKRKIAMFSDLEEERIIEARDQKSIYSVPLAFQEQWLHDIISERLRWKKTDCHMEGWQKIVHNLLHPEHEINIAIAGKYTALDDSYISVVEALKHAWAFYKSKVNIHWLNTEELETKAWEADLKKFIKENDIHGILVPGGFGDRGIEWMINVADYARKNSIPYFGICLGMQVATISFARHVCGLAKAHSTEFDLNTPDPVIDFLEDQRIITKKWGTMRLGDYPAILAPGTKMYQLYKQTLGLTTEGPLTINERHRHRYEVNPKYHEILKKNGLVFSGMSPDGSLVEFSELKEHPCFIGTQAHPEFKSRLQKPHPMFLWLVKASLDASL